MNKIKVLTYSLIALVVFNVGMIVFFKIIKPRDCGGSFRNGPRKMIVEKLHFDAKQQQQLEASIESHIKKIKSIEDQIQHSKESLYGQLSLPKVDIKAKDSLITELGDLQKQIETSRFNHFKNIKQICNTPEQEEAFKELTVELSKMFSHKRMAPQGQAEHSKK